MHTKSAQHWRRAITRNGAKLATCQYFAVVVVAAVAAVQVGVAAGAVEVIKNYGEQYGECMETLGAHNRQLTATTAKSTEP